MSDVADPPIRVVGWGFTLSRKRERQAWRASEERARRRLDQASTVPEPAPEPTDARPQDEDETARQKRQDVVREFGSIGVLDVHAAGGEARAAAASRDAALATVTSALASHPDPFVRKAAILALFRYSHPETGGATLAVDVGVPEDASALSETGEVQEVDSDPVEPSVGGRRPGGVAES